VRADNTKKKSEIRIAFMVFKNMHARHSSLASVFSSPAGLPLTDEE